MTCRFENGNTKEDWIQFPFLVSDYSFDICRLPPFRFLTEKLLRVIPRRYMLRRIGQFFVKAVDDDAVPIVGGNDFIEFYAYLGIGPHPIDFGACSG